MSVSTTMQYATAKIRPINFPPPKHLLQPPKPRMISLSDLTIATPKMLYYLLIGGICSLLFLSSRQGPHLFLPNRLSTHSRSHSADVLNPIYNETLGFQEAFTIELPERKDRLEKLYESCNATGISLSLRNGIKDDEAEDDRPPRFPEDLRNGDLACAVTHIRAWRMITESSILTTLITEGDADWDPRLKDQLAAFASAAAPLTNYVPISSTPLPPYAPDQNSQYPTISSPHLSPYGNDWDLLWLGSCGVSGSYYIPYIDRTVPPRDHEHELIGFKYGHEAFPDSARRRRQRLAVHVNEGVCTQAYAISLRGAQKLLAIADEMDTMVDHWLGLVCGAGKIKCVAPWPQIFDDAKSISSMDWKEGDQSGEPDGAKGDSVLEYSVRVNAAKILEGEGSDTWVRNWD